MREQFEEKYREMHPDDTCTLMPSGNYSGWMKQASWEGWQMRQAEVAELRAQSHGLELKLSMIEDLLDDWDATIKSHTHGDHLASLYACASELGQILVDSYDPE